MQPTAQQQQLLQRVQVNGGRFDFDDGGTYCGGWEDGKAHGHGVCTGPKGQGEYSGSWHYGFEVSGVYTWPSGSTFEGHWQNGKRHGLGVESRGRWVYRGEWTQGFKGRYGVRQSTSSGAKYEGTWANGLQDGYGSETYADGGTFQGQWLRGMRHGYGVRTSAPFGLASFYRNKTARASLTSIRSDTAAPDPASDRDRKMDDSRGGFVLKANSDEPPVRRRSLVEKSTNLKKSILQGLRIKKQRSTGDIDKRGTGSIRSTGSSTSWASTESAGGVGGGGGGTNASQHTDSNVSFVSQDEALDANVTETYMGEWKNDKRCGFGISERSDGLKYEGEWYNNKKYGYGVTTLLRELPVPGSVGGGGGVAGVREEGKYKNNVLITSNKKKHIFLIRSAKFRERVDAAVNAAIRASQIALQKADIAISRTATARGKAEQADVAAMHAREDSDFARLCAKQFAPEFHQPGIELLKKNSNERQSQEFKLSLSSNRRDDLSINNSQQQLHQQQQQQQQQQQMPFRNSKSLYARNDYEPSLYGQDDHQHSSPGGLRMSIDYGQPMMDNSNQRLTIHDHPSTNDRTYAYANATNKPYPDNTGGGRLLAPNGGPNDAISFSIRGSVRRGRNQSIRDDPRSNHAPPHGSYQQAMNDHFDQYQVTSETPTSSHRHQPLRSGTPQHGGSSTTVASAQAFAAALRTRPGPGSSAAASQYGGADWTPDSGVTSDGGADTDESPTRPSRRSTLPNLAAAELLAREAAEMQAQAGGGARRRGPLLPTSGVAAVDIAPSPLRTASLYVNPVRKTPVPPSVGGGGGGGGGARSKAPMMPAAPPKRKKSLPDIGLLPKVLPGMSREEVSVMSSARREEVRRLQDEAERYRANPLLYIFNPNVKDWLSRQQLMMLVLFINISLAIMFFKLLT